MTKAVLFAGPTLHGCPPLPGWIDLRPPAQAGDVARAARDAPPAIAIVDGVFGSAPSVWHKEVLDALDRGVPVLGAASLGAIRAAELHSFGMVGVGQVYEAYRDGVILRDDAVLVAHGPAELGYPPLSVALVDAEATITASSLPMAEHHALMRAARRVPFHLRTWQVIAAAGRPAAAASLSVAARSVKREDALMLVQALAQVRPPNALPSPRLVMTRHYQELLQMPAASSPS